MNFPLSNRLEMPILQELAATGGREDVRFLYSRLISYFPQLDKSLINNGKLEKWRLLVQRAGRELDELGYIKRSKGIWTLTKSGFERVASETTEFPLQPAETADKEELTHNTIQQLLVETGRILGFYAQTEFEFYDVIWRASEKSPRLSHVFEVQHHGNLDSALAKLKRAYDAQRSKIFLIINAERDANRAKQSLTREFHELENVLTILTFRQIKLLHQSLHKIADFLPKLLDN
jgi:hypothetical protein